MGTDSTPPGAKTTQTEPDGTPTEEVMDPITAADLTRRRNVALATDDADASHQGGMGAQGGAADFGNPKNFAS